MSLDMKMGKLGSRSVNSKPLCTLVVDSIYADDVPVRVSGLTYFRVSEICSSYGLGSFLFDEIMLSGCECFYLVVHREVSK